MFTTADDDDPTFGGKPTPHQVFGDIMSTRLRHGPQDVQVRVTFVDLSSSAHLNAPSNLRLGIVVYTDEGIGRQVMLDVGGRAPKATMSQLHPYGDRVPCALDHSIDYRRNLVSIGIPLECLVDPTWVRIGGVSLAQVHNQADTFSVDDALTPRDDTNESPALSPRLYHAN